MYLITTQKNNQKKSLRKCQKFVNNENLAFFQKRNKPIEIGTWSEYGEQSPETIYSYDYMY
jgi:hypothetical protein